MRPSKSILTLLLAGLVACGGSPGGDSLPQGLVLSLSQFETTGAGPKPGPALLEFLHYRGGEWKFSKLEDPDSNVFHKAMAYTAPGAEAGLLTLGGTAAMLKLWRLDGGRYQPETLWEKDFGGKFSRMRDAEIGNLLGSGAEIAVATHDQGVVAVVVPGADGFEVRELDQEKDTFVHEIEIGDLDGDGTYEFYSTPSEPNRLDGSVQPGKVVRYVPGKSEGRVVVADLGDRHAKEILVKDVDGDGRDELYVSVEGHVEGKGASRRLVHPVEIRRYDADTDPKSGTVIATLQDQLCRFLTAGDVDGDGKLEMVAAAFREGVWLLRPGAGEEWTASLIDADSGGFEHASILTDLDGDGRDELYVVSDQHGEVRRYLWDGVRFNRETIYSRPKGTSVFTWNIMPLPAEMIPER